MLTGLVALFGVVAVVIFAAYVFEPVVKGRRSTERMRTTIADLLGLFAVLAYPLAFLGRLAQNGVRHSAIHGGYYLLSGLPLLLMAALVWRMSLSVLNQRAVANGRRRLLFTALAMPMSVSAFLVLGVAWPLFLCEVLNGRLDPIFATVVASASAVAIACRVAFAKLLLTSTSSAGTSPSSSPFDDPEINTSDRSD